MRSKVKALPLLLLLWPFAAPAAAQGEKPVYKLGLILQEDGSRKNNEEKQIDAQVLNAATDAFLAARRFKMVERSQIASIFTEKSLQDFIGGKVNNKLSDVLDLDMIGIVSHRVENQPSEHGQVKSTWFLEVRLLDVKTASLLVSLSSKRASALSMLPPATPAEASPLLAQSIRDAFPPMGFIIEVDDKEVVVDFGSEVGLKKGDTLEVVQEGRQIIHPVTGEVVQAPLKVVGELKVVSASSRQSICKRASRQGEFELASAVRLKGTESAIIKGLMLVPRFKKQFFKEKGELEGKD